MKESILGIQIRSLFSRNLKRLRADAKLSQIDLAAEADLSHNFINDIESGKKWASPETIGKLSAALKTEPFQFFLPDSKENDPASEMISIYIDDIEKTHTKIVSDLRRRYLPEDAGSGKASGKKKKKNN